MASKKSKRRQDRNGKFNSDVAEDWRTKQQGPDKISWNLRDMKPVSAMNESQRKAMASFAGGDHLCMYGCAGTGKTYLALTMAMKVILDEFTEQDRVIVVRSVAATEDIGALPGTEAEKTDPLTTPYRDILGDLFGKASTYDLMEKKGLIEFKPTAFIRGLTWDNAVIVIDECQNMSKHIIMSVLTRVGANSRVIILGDGAQSDIKGVSGFNHTVNICKNYNMFENVEFFEKDIVRSDFVRDILTLSAGIEQEEFVAGDNGNELVMTTPELQDWFNHAIGITSSHGVPVSMDTLDYLVEVSQELIRREADLESECRSNKNVVSLQKASHAPSEIDYE